MILEQIDESVEPRLMCKDKLKELAGKIKQPLPTYKMFFADDGFVSSVKFNGHHYTGKGPCRTPQYAEQMVAQAALIDLIETSLQYDQQHRETVDKGNTLNIFSCIKMYLSLGEASRHWFLNSKVREPDFS